MNIDLIQRRLINMENKEIYIDGVDVSGCPYYIYSDGSCSSHDCECIKCIHNVCFYKDYKAKEQECERWKKANDVKNELLAKLGCPTVATARRKVFTLQQQIDTLKEDNEKIKENRDYYKRIVDGCPDVCENGFCQIDFYNKKLKQTLAEIKEIAEENFYFLDCDYRWILEKILQKISECEVENE